MSRWYILLPCLASVLVAWVAVFAYHHGAGFPILDPAGPIALQERAVMFITLALCAIIVVPVFFLLFYFAWKYRAGNPRASVHHRPDWDHDSAWAEFSWWLPPTAIIVVLGIVMWQSAHQLDPYKPLASNNQPLTVEVVALDWKWLFIYPQQGVASVNELVLPENIPVHFLLTANAPMNSFWIPALGGQIMVMPGMQTQLNLMASKLGTFNGFSGNISGAGFSGMAFTAQSVSLTDFAAWVAAAASSTSLDATTYAALAEPSEYNTPVTYAFPQANLFNSVIMNYMMPAMNAAPSAMTSMASGTMDMSMPMQ